MFETEKQKRAIQHWSKLAIQLTGAVDSGKYDHITTAVIADELRHDRIFAFLKKELPANVWDICKLDDVERHQLEQQWKIMSQAYEPAQFHVTRNGLALLVAYTLHWIDSLHSTLPR